MWPLWKPVPFQMRLNLLGLLLIARIQTDFVIHHAIMRIFVYYEFNIGIRGYFLVCIVQRIDCVGERS